MTQIGLALGMQAYLRDLGVNVFRLCVGGFIQGRRVRSVAAVALYIACRRQHSGNHHMLIDFADVLQVSRTIIISRRSDAMLTLRVA